MEVVQGKSSNKKIVVAQEIAFAKVLAGNNKTLRDRAVKKLRKWLRIRGNGKWAFTEDEFIRIWTGLFYCMWMSDKFLVQEELAESISQLIHCFKKSSDNALLFIRCFNKRILMEWEGLDQYRIDKFNMLVRRFLRQTFVYCKKKQWDESVLNNLIEIFYDVVLHRDNSLGFVLHFINIYAEELAKVSEGKLDSKTVLTLIEPFVRLISASKEIRIQREAEEFFNYLMRQTDAGIEYEEKFAAWKQQGFPGSGPHSLKRVSNGREENGVESESEEGEEEEEEDENAEPLDPRAGSVHVFLPQIPLDVDGVLELFKKYESAKEANTKGRKILRCLSHKYMALRRGKFPQRIKKDPILDENLNKRKRTVKNALDLLEFTRKIDEGPIKTKELKAINKQLLQEQSDEEDERENVGEEEEAKGEVDEEQEELNGKEGEEEEVEVEVEKEEVNYKKVTKKRKLLKEIKSGKKKKAEEEKTKVEVNENAEQPKKKNKSKKKRKKKEKKEEEEEMKKEESPKESKAEDDDAEKATPFKKGKRKILRYWQVQDLDPSSPEYYKIETPKVIRIEKKVEDGSDSEENKKPAAVREEERGEEEEKKEKKEIFPVFWAKARAKAFNKRVNKSPIYVNPLAQVNGEAKSSGLRRISFALDKNMAQENEEYLEEVKNSPRVPFDGSKKPVQSALKSGLPPSPVNPFYRFKKIKF